jgi:hypothetical protein
MSQDRHRVVLRAAGLALLLALLIAGLLKSRGTDPGSAVARPAAASGSPSRPEPPSVIPEEVTGKPGDEEPEFEPPIDDGPLGAHEGCVGFLFRDGSSFALDSTESPEPGKRNRFPLRSAPIAADPRLEALSPSQTRNFDSFLDLKEDVKSVPHFWMDLSTERVRTEEDDVRHPDKMTAINRTEILTDEWLLAWREMYRAAEEILRLVKGPPRLEKRGSLLDAAGRLRDGWTRARAERKGEGEWKRQAERECLDSASPVLEILGLRDGGPCWPSRDELNSLIMGASGPAEFGRRVTEMWGDGAQDAFAMFETTGGMLWVRVSVIAANDESEFAQLKAWAVAGFKTKPLKPAPGSLEVCGVTFMDLDDSDRARLALLSGAKVMAVLPGSAGDRAGLKVGDIVFATEVRELEFEADFSSGKPIMEALDLSCLIDWKETPVEIKLLVFRGDGEASVVIPRD